MLRKDETNYLCCDICGAHFMLRGEYDKNKKYDGFHKMPIHLRGMASTWIGDVNSKLIIDICDGCVTYLSSFMIEGLLKLRANNGTMADKNLDDHVVMLQRIRNDQY